MSLLDRTKYIILPSSWHSFCCCCSKLERKRINTQICYENRNEVMLCTFFCLLVQTISCIVYGNASLTVFKLFSNSFFLCFLHIKSKMALGIFLTSFVPFQGILYQKCSELKCLVYGTIRVKNGATVVLKMSKHVVSIPCSTLFLCTSYSVSIGLLLSSIFWVL